VQRTALLFKQRLAEIKIAIPAVIAEVRGEGLLIGLRALVPAGELVDALRAEKMLTVGRRRQCRAVAAAADRQRAGNRRGIARLDRACAGSSAPAWRAGGAAETERRRPE
jgi:acetylornithine/N-succinyldiaminopimelate aminotransferase